MSSRRRSLRTPRDPLPQMMSQLNINSPSSSDLAAGQLQTPPRHSSGLAESQPATSSLASPRMNVEFRESSEEDGYQQGPKRVTVLNTTKIFIYDTTEEKKMFHATVATEKEFFRVMVFNVQLKNMFARKKPIVFIDYLGSNGCLMIHKISSVSTVSDSSKMDISDTLKKNISMTPTIFDLHQQTKEMLVYGDFKVFKKRKGNNCICYTIKDVTGEMELVVSGRLTSVNCKNDDIVRLVGFELTSNVDRWFLRATRYSYMEVIKPEDEEQ